MIKPIIKDTRIALENTVIARDVLAERGIHIYLDFGTLLGAIRERGFIPHDDDVDVGIKASEEAAFVEAIPELVRRGLDFEEKSTKMNMYTFARGGEHLDVFVAHEQRTLFGRRWNLEGRATVPARHLDTYDEIDFLGQRFKVPHDPEGFARNLYGRSWRVPIANKPSRIDWSTRFRKLFRNPVKVAFYVKRFVAKRTGWAAAASKGKKIQGADGGGN